ncbi:HEAT-like repeat-containing protein [Desulforamulus aeronauticus DSM 10349]|uniref:HEAT-like repeat-containing protein n=2 Tax=Desulforamulus aeronauticus TaxID=53343 RepID=A0A1M6WM41_9FIRM|nr:HEAT-like repeat-containing protein [Desulforamulus aeronauticus DSM 10349]
MMKLKQEVELYLTENNYPELAARVLQNPGMVKYLFRLLYHPYGAARWQAIQGLGQISEEMVKNDPETVRELLRRLLWSMNDESGSASWSAPEAIGEIIARNPELLKEYVSIVVHASEEEIFHRGIAWALGRVGGQRPDLVQSFIPLLREFLVHRRPEVRGYAAQALGRIGKTAVEALPDLKGLDPDMTEIEVYEKDQVVMKSVWQLVQDAVARIVGEI